jgi:hypothetical protein
MDWRVRIGANISAEQVKGISEIARDVGQVCLASAVVPFLVPSFAPDKLPMVLLGLGFAASCWLISIYLLKYIRYE